MGAETGHLSRHKHEEKLAPSCASAGHNRPHREVMGSSCQLQARPGISLTSFSPLQEVAGSAFGEVAQERAEVTECTNVIG